MKKSTFITSFIIVTLIVGCVRSLYPLFTEEDICFNPKLVGTWTEKDGKNVWIFQKSGEKNYELSYFQAEYGDVLGKMERGDTAKFTAQLGKLGKYYFLDISPGETNTKVKNGFYNFHLLPVHSISRIWIEGDTLRLSLLDNDWLKKMIDNNAFKISHSRINDQIILTASTEELQDFVVRYAENNKAFPKPGELLRKK